ncbi:MAG: hypothetical protein ACRYGK_06430 [Janthinobacterium lividum]
MRLVEDSNKSRLKEFYYRAMPFGRFRDAARGTEEQCIANYRHNRAQRGILPFFIFKWIGIALSLMMLLDIFSRLMQQTMAGSLAHWCATTLCMGMGIAFSFACVMIAIISVTYLYLCRRQR